MYGPFAKQRKKGGPFKVKQHINKKKKFLSRYYRVLGAFGFPF